MRTKITPASSLQKHLTDYEDFKVEGEDEDKEVEILEWR